MEKELQPESSPAFNRFALLTRTTSSGQLHYKMT
jgi:hypothetical protein